MTTTATSPPTANPGIPFAQSARLAATEWKTSSAVLPAEAREAAPYRGSGPPYPFCLPVQYSVENLLPDARVIALERFAAAAIPWHHGLGGGPSNHLLSSQVQCANALAPLVDQPAALAEVFSSVLPIDEVMRFGAEDATQFDHDDHVVFEWNGATDYLGERGGSAGTRGAKSTSVDAAIRYRTSSGSVEVALIEWKYIEQYVGHRLSGGQKSLQVRQARYRSLFDDHDSPINADAVPYEALFDEPLYQLMRQQFLAWRMELANELGADKVRVVVVAPSLNHQLSISFDRALGDAVGLPASAGVHELWLRILACDDRLNSPSSRPGRQPIVPNNPNAATDNSVGGCFDGEDTWAMLVRWPDGQANEDHWQVARPKKTCGAATSVEQRTRGGLK